jgi:hypothetical protein
MPLKMEAFVSKGYIFASPRSDPAAGRPLADPMFGRVTTMGMCRPDLRKLVKAGDHLFVLSGKIKGVSQYLIGGLAVDEKIDSIIALDRFPENSLKILPDGNKRGNLIVTPSGGRSPLDHHSAESFEKRVKNFIVAREAIYLNSDKEAELGRERTLDVLRHVFDDPKAKSVHEIVYRNRVLDEKQVKMLLDALSAIKSDARRELPR